MCKPEMGDMQLREQRDSEATGHHSLFCPFRCQKEGMWAWHWPWHECLGE